MDWIAFCNPFSYDGSPITQTPRPAIGRLYEDEIIVTRVDEDNNPPSPGVPNNNTYVYRLARAYSRSDENFWAQPHAAISRDGKYIVFTSNMAHPGGCPANMHVANECSDVYLIKVQ